MPHQSKRNEELLEIKRVEKLLEKVGFEKEMVKKFTTQMLLVKGLIWGSGQGSYLKRLIERSNLSVVRAERKNSAKSMQKRT
jgi:hypothetical protein